MKSVFLCTVAALLTVSSLARAEDKAPLPDDASKLTGKKGILWRSEVMTIRTHCGTTQDSALGMEFIPAATVTHEELDDIVTERLKKIAKLPKPATPMDAKVQLWLITPSKTFAGGEGASSASGWLEVRLADGFADRTLKLTRSLETVSGPDEGTQRRLERDSTVYTYEWRKDKFVLKSIPGSVIRWGQMEFAVPTGEVEFTVKKEAK
jgi:hypothetical protein